MTGAGLAGAPQPVIVVGVPVGGVEDIAPRGRAAIAGATLLCGGARHLAAVASHGEERVVIGDVDACVERLRRRHPEERAVVLGSGDPLLFGIGASLVRDLGRASVRVLPAASSVQEAFARAGLAWQGAVVVSAHGRPLAPAVDAVVGAATAAGTATAAILCGPDSPPERVAGALLAAGLEDGPCVVAACLGEPDERVVEASLSAVAAGHHPPLSVVVLEAVAAAAARSAAGRFGRGEAEFSHARGMVTRAEVRAVVLSRLHPAAAAVVWDVGAGSGSIGLEAAALSPRARVFAVERSEEQLAHLRANVAALGGDRVAVVAGEAPTALAGLPRPDAVVVGGHGGQLAEILAAVVDRLRPGGRVVCSLATLEGVAGARAALAGWDPEVTQVGVARGVSAGRGLRLRAEDPVFLVSATAPGAP